MHLYLFDENNTGAVAILTSKEPPSRHIYFYATYVCCVIIMANKITLLLVSQTKHPSQSV